MEKVISKLSNEELDLVVGGEGEGFFASMLAGMGSTFKYSEGLKFGDDSGELSKAGFYAGKYLVFVGLNAISAVASAGITYLCTKKKSK